MSSPNAPLVGSARQQRVTFRDSSGALFDPPVVLFKLSVFQLRVETVLLNLRYGVDGAVTRISPGVYQCAWAWTQTGRHVARWQGLASTTLGGAEAAAELVYNIEASLIGNPILP